MRRFYEHHNETKGLGEIQPVAAGTPAGFRGQINPDETGAGRFRGQTEDRKPAMGRLGIMKEESGATTWFDRDDISMDSVLHGRAGKAADDKDSASQFDRLTS